jgi:hypothetical protein
VLLSLEIIRCWSLRCPGNGGSTGAPQRLGAEVRPGSKKRAKVRWGSLGTWEGPRTSLSTIPGRMNRVNNIQASKLRLPGIDERRRGDSSGYSGTTVKGKFPERRRVVLATS